MSSLVEEMKEIELKERELQVTKELAIKKAINSNNPADIIKGSDMLSQVLEASLPKGQMDRKSILFDPFTPTQNQGFLEKNYSVNDGTLRKMARMSPIIKAIVTTRCEQIAAFCVDNPDRYSTGFVIRAKKKLGESDQDAVKRSDPKTVKIITDFVLKCGVNATEYENDDFASFIKKITADSLTLDKIVFEVVRSRKGLPVQICSTDAALTKIVDPRTFINNKNAKKINGFYPSYCQVYDGIVINDFYPWEMSFGIRNPTTDIKDNGYGVSELEDLVHTVTSMLWTDEYNSRFFKQGSMPKGILKVSQGVSQSKLNELRQEWLSMVSGVHNAHRTPVIEADKFDWIDLHKANREMEYSNWQEYLIKLACAIYKIDPSEIGFHFSGGSDSSPMFERNSEKKLKHSKDKGLKPILKFIQFTLNKSVIYQINPDYELVFVGIDSETEQQEDERLIKAVSSFMTVNEVRAAKGMKPIKGGDLILNPIYMQAQMMEQQNQQAESAKKNDVNPDEIDNPYSSDEANDGEEVEKGIVSELSNLYNNIVSSLN